LLRQLVHRQDCAAQPGILVGVLRALRHGDAMAFGERFKGFIKTDALFLHHELHHIAAGSAGKALVELVHHVDREGGALLRVEGAEPHVAVRPGFAQPHIFPDHPNDVYRGFEVLDELHGVPCRLLSRTRSPATLPGAVSLSQSYATCKLTVDGNPVISLQWIYKEAV